MNFSRSKPAGTPICPSDSAIVGRLALLCVVGAFSLASDPLLAKDLRGRVGAGMDSQITLSANPLNGPASLSVKYTLPSQSPAVNMQFQGFLGISVVENEAAAVVAGGRFLYTVVAEDNCNVFVGIGGVYVRDDAITSNIIRVQPLAGVEFFLFGLENLGFSASIGLNVDIGSPVSVMTTGASTGNLGIHYYF